jgi:hypothetical protein
MGLEDDFKEAEQAIDGQSSANQVAANEATGKGNDAMEDTVVDSGRFYLCVALSLCFALVSYFISLLQLQYIMKR